ncbi:hypothetical protein TVAG_455130 [Trichomonas vaginalis G3]|uniref:Polycystin cation channel PKD1/PKD2 domain-containing protein n=1 Tax=Trichomonas vaginalis (strain ATCC PRA-98 / G3) TaxID=412133 RepID=A2FMX5_TRIV3|nr:mucolipin family [Trichomonas vaginalis G3]EAX93743.1 hypothetical protein TVAG_455130 [Trichomonas vaginalis G3]KAI5533758.1 mucolipin family [Trichomonas vaginalis G3]|eukprot:XP_001306673.1 hypothetical protein [Trichomonas vaginalis G3]
MIPFFQDFGRAIDGYFLEGHSESEDDDIEDIYGDAKLYTKSDVLDALNGSFYKYLFFTDIFPCSYPLSKSSDLTFQIKLKNQEQLSFIVTEDNVSVANDIALKYIDTFTIFSLSMTITLHPREVGTIDSYQVGVSSIFEFYYGTSIIVWKNLHERSILYSKKPTSGLLTQWTITSAAFIVTFSLICCIITVISLIRFYQTAKQKALKERTSVLKYFRIKLDPWEPISFLLDACSVICVSIFIKYSKDINDSLPWPMFLLSASSFAHVFVLFKYFRLVPSLYLIVRMLEQGIGPVFKFLIGCMPFFFGYIYVGVCLFGWYSPHYTSPRQAAKLLISACNGDYLLDGYDEMAYGADKSKLIPSIYFTSFIFQGLCIWFYVTLAIFHELLEKLIEEEEGYEDESRPQRDEYQKIPTSRVFDNSRYV